MKRYLLIICWIIGVFGEAPYAPSGWKPSGENFVLPPKSLRQTAGTPHTVYGPPSTETSYNYDMPSREYGEVPYNTYENNYGVPQKEEGNYGPPENQSPVNNYGVPQKEDGNYGPPENQSPVNNYGAPQAEEGNYGPPANNYGSPQNPDYGAPENSYGNPTQVEEAYGKPNEQNSMNIPSKIISGKTRPSTNFQLPLDLGASEKIKQSHFVQNLPHFEPANFKPMILQNQVKQKLVETEQPLRYRTISVEDYKRFEAKRINNNDGVKTVRAQRQRRIKN